MPSTCKPCSCPGKLRSLSRRVNLLPRLIGSRWINFNLNSTAEGRCSADRSSSRLGLDAELDPGTVLPAGEFPGVAQQMLKRAPQELVISLGGQSRSDLPFHGAVRLGGLQLRQHGFGQAAEIDGFALEFRSAHLRQLQQLMDDLAHLLGEVTDVLEVFPGLAVQVRPAFAE